MNPKKIAVFFGGRSPEYRVSLESAYSVLSYMDKEKFQPVPIGISQEGCWYLFTGDMEKIKNDTWQNETDCIPAAPLPGPDGRLLLLSHNRQCGPYEPSSAGALIIDAALPILHGQNGEDGTIQGLLTLSGIPVAGCGVLSSALCMDKDRAHKLAGAAGLPVPRSFVASPCTDMQTLLDFAARIGYPLFVKPVRAGSSYGITKVQKPGELPDAVKLAFQYDTNIILEENIDGFEVGCAVMGRDTLICGEVDEIRLTDGFFNFTEKYTLKTSSIHVPARISPETAEEIKETARRIYRALDCAVFARVDLFLIPSGKIVFNEVNTIPGFTEHSRFPGMMKAVGFSFTELVSAIIEQALDGKNKV